VDEEAEAEEEGRVFCKIRAVNGKTRRVSTNRKRRDKRVKALSTRENVLRKKSGNKIE